MHLTIKLKGEYNDLVGSDVDFDRWLAAANKSGKVPVEMVGDLVIMRMERDVGAKQGTCVCEFAGRIVEGEPYPDPSDPLEE